MTNSIANRQYAWCSILISLTCLPFMAAAQLPADSITAILNQEVAARRTTGIIVGVIDTAGQTHIYSAGICSKARPVAPDKHTLFEIGSVTKVFTSVILAENCVQHRMQLDDPINKYLPATYQWPTWNGQPLTLLHLATHSTGMPRMPANNIAAQLDNPFATYNTNKLYQYVSAFTIPREPGKQFQYSNSAYALLGQILMLQDHQKSYEALVRDRINKPLGLTNTTVTLSRAQKANLAIGHSEYNMEVSNWDLTGLEANGALRSNMNDMLIFAAANAGVVKSELYPAMQLSHVPHVSKGNDGDISLGWTIKNENGHQFVWKDGTTGGYRALVLLDKSNKTGVVILSNSQNPINDIAYHILDATYPVKPYKYKWQLLDVMKATIETKGIDAAIEQYDLLKKTTKGVYSFEEAQLNYVGDDLVIAGKNKEALKIYTLNASEYPTSPLVYSSLAELYYRMGDKQKSIENFEKLLAIDPGFAHAKWMIAEMKKVQ